MFLEHLMLKMCFDMKWVESLEWVMKCVNTVSYNILMIEKHVSHFVPSRGIRQRDPLFSYLFLLVADVLSLMIQKAVARENIRGLRIKLSSAELTHFFFRQFFILLRSYRGQYS